MTSAPDVSVILPVYNTMPDLKLCLESLVGQEIGRYNYEMVAVDDGSTDGSGELLDEYAAHHDNMRVIHQENSGWPGRPRNVGVSASNSRYVFFMDADDELGRQALRRLVAFADRHSSDIVVPLQVSVPGAVPSGNIWRNAGVDANRALLFKTLSPHKLFRRAFLDEHDLRFPEGKVPLEDGLVLARAYLLARRVSVVADYVYYYKRDRTEGGNISAAVKPPKAFADSVTAIIDIVRELAADPDVADQVIVDIYRRKALKYLGPDRFPRYRRWRMEAWVKAIAEMAETRIPPAIEARLPLEPRLRSLAARTRDADAVKALADGVNAGAVPAHVEAGRVLVTFATAEPSQPVDVTDGVRVEGRLVAARAIGGDFVFDLEIVAAPLALRGGEWALVLRGRKHPDREVSVPLERAQPDVESSASVTRVTGVLPAKELTGHGLARWAAQVSVRTDRPAAGPTALRPGPLTAEACPALCQPIRVGRHRVEPYLTVNGTVQFATTWRFSPLPHEIGLTDRALRWARKDPRVKRLARKLMRRPLASRVIRRIAGTSTPPGLPRRTEG